MSAAEGVKESPPQADKKRERLHIFYICVHLQRTIKKAERVFQPTPLSFWFHTDYGMIPVIVRIRRDDDAADPNHQDPAKPLSSARESDESPLCQESHPVPNRR
jgi:hypothetical protein